MSPLATRSFLSRTLLCALCLFAVSACGGSGSDSSSTSASTSLGAWHTEVPFDLENLNPLFFRDENFDSVYTQLSLDPIGLNGDGLYLYDAWVLGTIPSIEVSTPNGILNTSIDLASFSPFRWTGRNALGAGAWYDPFDREITVGGETPALLYDGIDTWQVLVGVTFYLSGETPNFFLSDPGSSFSSNVKISADPISGLFAWEVWGIQELSNLELTID